MKFQFVMESRRRKCNLLILFLSRTLEIVEIKYMKYIYLNHGFGSNICIWYIARLYSFFMSIYFNSSGIGKEERNDRPPSWLVSSIERRGHGLESCSSLNFFQAFFSQLFDNSPLTALGSHVLHLQYYPDTLLFVPESSISREMPLSQAYSKMVFLPFWNNTIFGDICPANFVFQNGKCATQKLPHVIM